MKALVTGATGLIGSHIVRALLDAGHEVRAMVRPTSNRGSLAGMPITWITADLLQGDQQLDAACAACDVVFHTAAHFSYGGVSKAELYGTAVIGTEAMLRSCSRSHVQRVVVTSSSVVFGYSRDGSALAEGLLVTAGHDDPHYIVAKLAQHQRALELGRQLALDVRLACPTMTLGPTTARLGPSNGAVVAYLADPLGCTFPGGCNLVSVSDVAAGHLHIAERGAAGNSYLLGSQNLTWPEIHTMIADLAGIAVPRLELNHSLALLAAAGEEIRAAIRSRAPLSTREQVVMIGRYYWYSHAKAAALGYTPRPARDALIETISWLAASPHISREVRTRMHLSNDIYRFRSSTPAHAP